jgi:hypothetical protein
VDDLAAVRGARDPVHAHLALVERDLRDFGDESPLVFDHGDATRAARRGLLPPPRLLGRDLEDVPETRVASQ